MGNNTGLFKDKFCTYSSKDGEEDRIVEDFQGLNDAISGDLDHQLSVLLCGRKPEDLIKDKNGEKSSSERGEHENTICSGVKTETEHPICKCMFYYDRQKHAGITCSPCFIEQPWTNISDKYEVVDYEFPMPYAHRIESIKSVDLVLKDRITGDYYAVEVKQKNSHETISRMMAETLTYTAVLEYAGCFGMKDNKILLPAIAFFEDSIQFRKYKEYKESANMEFGKMLKVIKVFKIVIIKNEKGLCMFRFEPEN